MKKFRSYSLRITELLITFLVFVGILAIVEFNGQEALTRFQMHLIQDICRLVTPQLQVGAYRTVQDYLVTLSQTPDKSASNMSAVLVVNGRPFIDQIADYSEVIHVCKFRELDGIEIRFSRTPVAKFNTETGSRAFLLLVIVYILTITTSFWIRQKNRREAKTLMDQEIGSLARQVAHDIRSPLSALNMALAAEEGIKLENRKVIGSALSRINEISNDLIAKSKREKDANEMDSASKLMTAGVDINTLLEALRDLIWEKRIEHASSLGLVVEIDASDQANGSVRCELTALIRIASNIINNSIEALPDNIGRVHIRTAILNSHFSILISDNGKGIPSSVLSRLGVGEVSYGKGNGSGLGISNAKYKLKSWGGNIHIKSAEGVGTEVELQILII